MNKAMQQFWSHGYSATSLDDLSAATGMNRPSLYAAFGNKQSIYLKSLEHFGDYMGQNIAQALSRPGRIDASLTRFFSKVLDVYFSGEDGARGCSVWCTAIVEAHTESAIRDFLANAIAQVDGVLEQRFVRAIKDGELSRDTDPKLLAKLAAASMHSIALRSRSGASRASLKKMTDASVRLLTQSTTQSV